MNTPIAHELTSFDPTGAIAPFVHEAIALQAAANPDAIALYMDGAELTYAQLQQRSNQLAQCLRKLGAGPERLVGVCLEKGFDSVVAVLALWQCGAAYLPLDPGHPAERIGQIVSDGAPLFVLAHQATSARLPARTARFVLDAPAGRAMLEAAPCGFIAPASAGMLPETLAYVVYTSGSTGKPKGVAVEQRHLAAKFGEVGAELGLSCRDVMPNLASPSFALAMLEQLLPLTAGGATLILAAGISRDMPALVAATRGATVLHAVPSVLAALLAHLKSVARAQAAYPALRSLLVGGEAVPSGLLRAASAVFPRAQLRALYGQTETTILSTVYRVCASLEGVAANHMGVPLARTTCHVLDEQGAPVPDGETGQLHLGGAAVARGYFGNPELSAQCFLDDPFGAEPGQRMYRSGDLVRRNGAGELEFLGRTDFQVKIRGVRIELGEIEHKLAGHRSVAQAVVLAHAGPAEEKRLVAYVTGRIGCEPPQAAVLRTFLLGHLPDALIPAAFVVLEQFPLTPNGKLDRKALLAPALGCIEADYVAPRSAAERRLAALWCQVLGLDRVGVHDNFFALGGHSLLATQLGSALRAQDGVELPLRALFEAPTLEALALLLEAGPDAALCPIVAQPRGEPMALSFAQQRMWFLDQLDPAGAAYNMPFSLELKGELALPALQRALDEIVRRHEALRTSFAGADGAPRQHIAGQLTLDLAFHDLDGIDPASRAAEAARLGQAQAMARFDLAHGPLLRAALVRINPAEHHLTLTLHHIAGDGWSMGVLVRELAALYRAFAHGLPSPLPELAFQYADLAHWQQQWLAGARREQQLAYWCRQLADAPVLLALPSERARPAHPSYRGAQHKFVLAPELCSALQRLAQEHQATLFMVLNAAFSILLARHSGQDDICVGTAIAGRARAEAEPLIGVFVNTLVLRTRVDLGASVASLLAQVRETALQAYAHQDLPFELLVDALKLERAASHAPLFQAMLVLQNAPMDLQFPGLEVRQLELDSASAKFDLTMTVEQGAQLACSLEYACDLFDPATAARLASHFARLLEAMAAGAQQSIGALPMLAEAERRQVLVEWNRGSVVVPAAPTIHQLFEQQAGARPDAPALVCEGEVLSYAALNARANRLAHHLRAAGVGPDVLVAICAERSLGMIVGLLAILKAGGAYLPLDPAYPQERRDYMLADARPALLLAERGAPGAAGLPLVWLDDDTAWRGASGANPEPLCAPENLAYVIYTSGSTGKPKGALLEHRNVLRLFAASQPWFGFGPSDTWTLFHSFAFDFSVWEIWGALLHGGKLVIVPYLTSRSPELFRTLLAEQQVTVLNQTPSAFQQLLEADLRHADRLALRQVIFGGEALDQGALDPWFGKYGHDQPQLVNMYGITETTVHVTYHRLTRGAPESIGRALPDLTVYLLDAAMNPVPAGVAGELYVGGAGLARGYLNRPELTSEKFVPDPFGGVPGARLYRSGDLARHLPDGSLAYLGRIDAQVKIRGFRIELGEIEHCLRRHRALQDALVLASAEAGAGQRLVAYVVPKPGHQADPDQLRAWLLTELPDYMVPLAWVSLAAFPLTVNGKLDRQALPAPELRRHAVARAPAGPTELALAAIWCEVLELEQVGADDNFFHLGGHSLLAARVLGMILARWPVALGIRSLFDHQSLGALAEAIEAAAPRRQAGIVARSGASEDYPVSHAQQRLWLQDALDTKANNIVAIQLELAGPLDIGALEQALGALVARHEILRTVYLARDGSPRQRILPAGALRLARTDLSGLAPPAQAQARERLAHANASTAFALAQHLPIRASLLTLGREQHVLLLGLHHIAYDGWSDAILRRELSALYRLHAGHPGSTELPPPALQYADYALWQRGAAERLAAQVGYWKAQLAGVPQVHSLPLDRPRPAHADGAGAVLWQTMPQPLAQRLRAFARQHDTTLFMLLHAAFGLLVGRYSDSSDVVVGAVQANREPAEVAPLIGLFMNPVALRYRLDQAHDFAALLRQARSGAVAAQENQEAPFDLVVEALGIERTGAHAPLIQLMLIMQNNAVVGWDLPGVLVEERQRILTQARLDLLVEAAETEAGIELMWEYSSALFEHASIARMSANFVQLLEAAMAACGAPLDSLDLLAAPEAAQLAAWNPAPLAIAADAPCIHELIEAAAAHDPVRIAVRAGARTLGYGRLNGRANELAHHLQGRGVRAGERVAVLMQRSPELAIAMLAVLKLGAIYVPIESDQPLARMVAILDEAAIRCVLTDSAEIEDAAPGRTFLTLDAVPANAAAYATNPAREANGCSAAAIAYTVFTSGSTGKPKGVEVSHGAILASYRAWEQVYDLHGASRRHLQMAGVAFDVCVGDLVRALCSGGTLVICPKATLLDAPALYRLIEDGKIDFAEFVPIALRNLVAHLEHSGERLSTLRFLVAGSDLWHAQDLQRTRKVLACAASVVNSYGLSEAAVDSTCYLLAPGEPGPASGVAPIGRPLANANAYVLNRALLPSPIGVPGELHVAGPALARGYLNRPELSAERFIANPFGPGKLYKTGDVARWRADGQLEIVGRMDHQVKIRGFRVELGDIESCLKSHPAVKEAVVVDFLRSASERQLAAYVTLKPGACDGGGDGIVAALRAHLAAALPDYMVPAALAVLPDMLANANGKIDRRALPAPVLDAGAAHSAPRTPVEAALAAIWCALLDQERIGRDAHFFHAGGHSLLAARMVAQVAEALAVTIPLRMVFNLPTLCALAGAIEQLLVGGGGAALAPIEPVGALARAGDLPLSFAQRRLWVVDQFEPGSPQYNISFALRLSGSFRLAAMQAALDAVVLRHEVLRTTYHETDGNPVQRIGAAAALPLALVDLGPLAPHEREAALQEHASSEAAAPFDLAQDGMLRAVLVRLDECEHVLLLTLHHIAADGWSLGILMREIGAAYASAAGFAAPGLPPLALQYADFAVWQLARQQPQQQAIAAAYWKRQMEGAPAVHGLPLDRARPARQSHRGATLQASLGQDAMEALARCAKAHQVTLFTVLHAALASLVARVSQCGDIVIGSPVANRERAELAPLVGFFANTVALRSRLEDDTTFAGLMRQQHQHLLDAIDTHALPFDQLVEALQPERSARHHPLFQILLVLQNNLIEEMTLPGLQTEVFRPRTTVAKFDLSLEVFEHAGRLHLNWEYASDLFEHSTVAGLAACFETLLTAALADPAMPVSKLALQDGAARARVLQAGTGARPATAPLLVHRYPELWSADTPARAAVRGADGTLSYRELERAANRLAHLLAQAGAGPDTVVGIALERSCAMVVAVLAVLKAGAAYVGLDPHDPPVRLAHIGADAGLTLLVCSAAQGASLAHVGAPLLCIDDPATMAKLAAAPDQPPAIAGLDGDSVAYLIYTSGTTGLPKAVLQRHRTLANLVLAQCAPDAGPAVLTASLPSLQFAALAFDVSIQELATAWHTGSELLMVSKDERMDPVRLAGLIAQHRIGRLFLPPAMLHYLAEAALEAGAPALECLAEIVVAGDVLQVSGAVQAFLARYPVTLLNHYGPSETHVVTQHRVCGADGAWPPIGRALAGHTLRIVDRHGALQPYGVAGQLLVSGTGVALCYLNRPDLSGASFGIDEDGQDCYRTGDLARWRADGALEFLGRIDQQVKIRGYRVELGEIENQLRQHPAVSDAAVTVRRDAAGQNQLVAYLVHGGAARLSSNDWHAHLCRFLPEHMVPAAFLAIDSVPLSPNGKVDRKRLPEPDSLRAQAAPKQLAAPRSATESALLPIWQQLLGMHEICIHDSFFRLGGHSLLAVQLASRAQKALGKPVPLRAILEHPSIAALAGAIDAENAAAFSVGSLEPAPQDQFEPFPLTDVQQAYWVGRSGEFALGNIGTHSYIEIPARRLDAQRMEAVWNRLVARHPMLRMVVTPDGMQRILAQVPRYRVHEHEGCAGRLRLRERMAHQSFSGTEWPLFEAALSHLDGERSVFHLSIDALALDAASAFQLGEEMLACYLDLEAELAPVSISFRDYVMAEQALRTTAFGARSRQYWLARMAHFPAPPELPLACEPSEIAAPHFVGRHLRLPAERWARLKALAAGHSVTPTIAVIGAFAAVLERFCKSSRFALNLTLFNRIEFHEEVGRLVGDFTSLTLLEIDNRGGLRFEQNLQRIQRQLWTDIEYKYFTGIDVVRELSRRNGQSVTYPVVVTSTLGLGDIAENPLSPFDNSGIYTVSQTPQVWLDFQLNEIEGALFCDWDSVAGLFPEGLLDAMFERFSALLETLAGQPEAWLACGQQTIPAQTLELVERTNATAAELAAGPGAIERLHGPLLAQIAARPGALAVRCGALQLTYSELGLASARLAADLRAGGAQPNQLVAVVMEKGWEQVVATLAILRSGAAYLPIDASLPAERIRQLLVLGEVSQVVTVPELAKRMEFGLRTYLVSEVLHGAHGGPADLAHEARQQVDDLAYVIFTSGSTGTPKGVMIDHRGALNTVLDINARYAVGAGDAVFGLSSLSFDLSVYDVFGVLGAGGTLVLPRPDEGRDPEAWVRAMEAGGVSVWNTVPALMQILVDYLEGRSRAALALRVVMLSGDWIPVDLPGRIQAQFPQAALYSLGGATEASIWSIDFPIRAVDPGWRSIPYGTALANQQFYVLKPDLSLCPVWTIGELYIGGIGLAHGYWRDPVKTGQHFVRHPDSGAMLYRTGDLGRLLPDGNLEFLGRQDHQVKIQGYRIELGEIEAQLKTHPYVRETVVHAAAIGNSRQLVAYVVPVGAPDPAFDPAERQAFIAAQPGQRRQFDALEGIALPQPAGLTLALRADAPAGAPRQGALGFEAFAALFEAASALALAGLPLPKRYYGSAGGLYPVQLHALLGADSVNGLEAGAYYYDALQHRLVRIGAPPASHPAQAARLVLAGDLSAIAPLYGDAALAFAQLEAGYLAQLLVAARPAGVGACAATAVPDQPGCFQALALSEHHRLLAWIELGLEQAGAPAPALTLERIARKSYRQFSQQAVAADGWDLLTAALRQALAAAPMLEAYALVKPNGVDGKAPGTYRFERTGGWTALGAACDGTRLFAENAAVAADAGFAILFAGAAGAGQACFHAGQASQAIVNLCTAEAIGLCALGRVDAGEAARLFALADGCAVLHAFLGGAVTRAQMAEAAVSGAPAIDLAALLRSHLGALLPAYMVPAHVVELDAIPLSGNGKVDRKALPAPADGAGGASASCAMLAPRTAPERTLCALWTEVLGLAQAGVQDNFFGAGGDSIRAIMLLTRAKKQGIVFTVRELYANPTIEALCQVARIEPAAGAGAQPAPLHAFALLDAGARAALDALEPGGTLEDAYPMTLLQQGMVFHNLLDGARGTYHDIISRRIELKLDRAAFAAALADVTARHAILRTVLRNDLEPPLQLVLAAHAPQLEVIGLEHESPAAQEAAIGAWIGAEKARAFEPGQPAWKVVLHLCGGASLQYTLVCHHALLDGWSVMQFDAQLFDAYRARCQGRAPAGAPALPYSRFVAAELAARASVPAKAYWQQTLCDAQLPWWSGVPAQAGSGVQKRRLDLGCAQHAAIEALARRIGVADRSILLAAHLVFQGVMTGQPETLTSVVTHCRPELEGAETALGLFLNTLPVRLSTAGLSWIELAQALDKRLHEMEQYRAYPLALIQKATGLDFSGSLFTYVNFGSAGDAAAELAGAGEASVDLTNYRLAFEVAKDQGQGVYRIGLLADDSLFDAAAADRMQAYLGRIFAALLADPDGQADAVHWCDEAERAHLARADTAHAFPDQACWHALFEAQVERTPDSVAVVDGEQEYSYAELNRRANRLAHWLAARSVGPGQRVGLLFERGIEMVVAIYAVLKAGAAYVPLDPSNPQARVALLVRDAQLGVVLTQSRFGGRLAGAEAAVLCLDDPASAKALAALSEANLEQEATRVQPHDTAYVIYTSGSTGQPKGVMVPHRGLVNRIAWMDHAYRLSAADAVLQKTPYGFDVSVWEFAWPLLTGARLVLAKPDGHKDPAYLAQLIARAGITTLHFVPSMLRLMLEHGNWSALASIRQVFCSGEALPKDLAEAFFASGTGSALHNLYGPTEASIDVSHWTCQAGDTRQHVPIGHPIWNTQLYVLGAGRQLVPQGVPGELYIGGAGLASGYLNQPGLTRERFVADPFAADAGARMYRTGDLVRRHAGGELEFLGRIDHQVKIRGFRIELGEIEAAIRDCDGVHDTVVVAAGERLVAYLASALGQEAHRALTGAVRTALRLRLPDYMVPASFVVLAQLPLNLNGKVDRKALPPPSTDAAGQGAIVQPASATEAALCRIFQAALGLEAVGTDQSFFDLGGDSLKLVRLGGEIRRVFGTDIALMALYSSPTVGALAAMIDAGGQFQAPLVQQLTAPGKDAQMALLAVPYAAGDGVIYHDLATRLGQRLSAYAVNNPRNFSAGDGLDAAVSDYLDALVDAVRAQITVPLIVWGHCIGYALALSLTRRLLQAGVAVRALCVGGALLDADHGAQSAAIGSRAAAPEAGEIVKLLSAAGLQAAHGEIDAAEWAGIADKFGQDSLLSTWCNHEHFCTLGAPRFDLPLYCVVARDDPLTPDAQAGGQHWKLVSDQVQVIELDAGGHYFVKTRSAEVAAWLDTLAEPAMACSLEAAMG